MNIKHYTTVAGILAGLSVMVVTDDMLVRAFAAVACITAVIVLIVQMEWNRD